jgi:pantoate--beta-alanine ligase
MLVLKTAATLREQMARWRREGKRCALVPTMGFLHEGHLTLVDHARRHADIVVLSIFVNPLQFGPQEDLATYPRDLERDEQLARARGVDLIFAPSQAEVYPHERPDVSLIAPGLTDRLCGRFRPGHFEGVLTVVAKLFNLVQPDVAVFGQKDFQQSVLIRRMTADLDFPIRIEVAPIVREHDGLAMSSRNVYLSPEQRRQASALSRGLQAGQAAFAAGQRNAEQIRGAAQAVLDRETDMRVQYLELVTPDRLAAVTVASTGDVLAVAAFVGRTRLIDNVILA